jgi:hypothetical protein
MVKRGSLKKVGYPKNQDVYNYALAINLIVFIMVLIYIYLAYNYLANLKSCKCVNGKYVENVKNAEALLMIVVLIWIIMSIWYTNNINKLTKTDIKVLMFLSAALGIFTFLLYIYFCYYVHKMQKTIESTCVCAMKWQRWLVYVQYGLFLYEIVLTVVSVMVGIIFMLMHIK